MATKKEQGRLHKLLEDIRNSDDKQVEQQLQIASLLTAIKDHKLYEALGYEGFEYMVISELEFPNSAAIRYISLYKSYLRLKYNEAEFLKLMKYFGWRALQRSIVKAPKKLGQRAIQNHLDARESRNNQFNFTLVERGDAILLEATLAEYGMETLESGVRTHFTDAFLAMVKDLERLKANERKKTGNKKARHAVEA